MGIKRFSNKEEIIRSKGKVRGLTWKEDDLNLLQLDTKNVQPDEKPTVEVHVYAPGKSGKYLDGGVISSENFELEKDQIFIDWASVCREMFNIERGAFEVGINVHKNLLGNEDEQALYINSISPDRREVHLKQTPGHDLNLESYLDAYGEESLLDVVYETVLDANGNEIPVLNDNGQPVVKATVERPLSDDISLNFGDNLLYRIINQKDWADENDFVVRLYQPLEKGIKEKDTLWIVEELSDTYFDNINIKGPGAVAIQSKILKGPNLQVDTKAGMITETDFRNWNQLLDANTSTAQDIVDSIFSGSLSGVPLGIDYTAFDNFIHFSSAKERIDNFIYKLEMLEYHDSRLKILDNASGSDTTALQGNVEITRKRRNLVQGSFDGFERWAHKESTSSLSTHGVSGSVIGADPYALKPWPKYLSGSKYYLHHTSSSLGKQWIEGVSATASLYDIHNERALVKTIPEHIRLDTNNAQYELFVNMMGQHYDILYSYIDNLTKIYYPEEQPKLGQSKDVIFQAAESLGWTLVNGKQASQLWNYKLGVHSGSGQYISTGSMFSKSDEDITKEVWRRILNNLPFLLKTKGTARGIKALMNTYGIPQTLLSIREYGGPKVGSEMPVLIEDRFTYALKFDSGSIWQGNQSAGAFNHPTGSFITWVDSRYSSSLTESLSPTTNATRIWGIQRHEVPTITHEVRIKPAVTKSMLLMSRTDVTGPTWQLALEHTASYSGSGKYGRLVYCHGKAGAEVLPNVDGFGNGGGAIQSPMTASSNWAPIFDGDWWNIRLWFQPTGSGKINNLNRKHVDNAYNRKIFNVDNNTSIAYHAEAQKASDYIKGKVIHSASLTITPEHRFHANMWSNDYAGDGLDDATIWLGGNNKGFGSAFAGLAVLWDANAGKNSVNQYINHFFNGILTGSKPSDRYLYSISSSFAEAGIGTFTGSMQEYREWLEVLDKPTFDIHTLNPASYVSSISPTSSYDTLIRHYPLGTDLNAVDHSSSIGRIISSSHPAQNFRDFGPPHYLAPSGSTMGTTYATASGFRSPQNAQRGNYEPVEETYYVQGVSLGGSLPKSQKIRLEDNKLVRRLSPKSSAERSSFDYAPNDTNRLGLFYSPADQINKEIFNHIGDVELDDFVGDPNDEFDNDYPDLLHFAKQYWKKYKDRNDVNAFIRIFSQFDFALFEQMKQLIPERVDEAMGLIVEPHAIERAKVRLTRLPVKEEPFFTGTIPEPSPTASGVIQPLSASISKPLGLEATSTYHLSASGYTEIPGNLVAYMSFTNATASMDYTRHAVYALDDLPMATASMRANYTYPQQRLPLESSPEPEGWNVNASRWINLAGNSGSTFDSASIPMLSLQNGITGVSATQDTDNITTNAFQSSGSNNRYESDFLRMQFNTYSEYDSIQDFTFTTRFAIQTGSHLGRLIPSQSRWYGRIIKTSQNVHAYRKRNLTPLGVGQTPAGMLDGGSYFAFKDEVSPQGFDNLDMLNDQPKGVKYGAMPLTPWKEITFDYFKLSTGAVVASPGSQIINKNLDLPLFFSHSFQNVHVEPRTHITYELYHSSASLVRVDSSTTYVPIRDWNVTASIDNTVCIKSIKKLLHHPSFDVEAITQRPSRIFRKQVFHYGTGSKITKIGREMVKFISQSADSYPGDFFSSSLVDADHMDDFFEQTNNLMFNGCRLTGPAVNAVTTIAAIDNRPVIEVYAVNPNQLIYTDQPDEGQAGNLIVR